LTKPRATTVFRASAVFVMRRTPRLSMPPVPVQIPMLSTIALFVISTVPPSFEMAAPPSAKFSANVLSRMVTIPP
jgi:hypothetical protein